MIFAWGAAPAAAAPEPEPFPTKWEFDFKPGPLRLTTVTMPDGSNGAYFYLTYQVANYSGRDRVFAPAFDLMTDQGQLIRAGRDVAPDVARTIRERLANPLLEDQFSIVDTLLQGKDNARFGLVIWPAAGLWMDEVSIFASGFSGESTVYFTTEPETGERRRHVLRKTRVLRYPTPGELRPGNGAVGLELGESTWVMR